MDGAVGTFDNVGHGIVFSNAGDEFGIRTPVTLGDEYIAGAAEVPWWLAQSSARQKGFGSERRAGIDQHDVHRVRQIEILHPVVQNKSLRFKLANCKACSLDPVLVHDHRHTIKVPRKHERLVTGEFRIE